MTKARLVVEEWARAAGEEVRAECETEAAGDAEFAEC